MKVASFFLKALIWQALVLGVLVILDFLYLAEIFWTLSVRFFVCMQFLMSLFPGCTRFLTFWLGNIFLSFS